MEELDLNCLPITREIAVDSTQLPGDLGPEDPGDQLVVATARQHDCPVASEDPKIENYSHVAVLPDE